MHATDFQRILDIVHEWSRRPLLQAVFAKRKELAQAAGIDLHQLHEYVASDEECQALMIAWSKDVESWMDKSKSDYYALLDQRHYQQAHQLRRSRFNSYCFLLSGCRSRGQNFEPHWQVFFRKLIKFGPRRV